MTRADLLALADKIERKRVLYGDARLYYPQGHDPLALEAVNALLDAAEAAATARDAALEEAARVAEDSEPDAGEFCDGAVKEHSAFIAHAIRSLRRPTWTCPMRGKTLERCGARDHGNDIRTCTVGGCAHMPVAQGGAA